MIKFVKIFNSKSVGYWYYPENNDVPGMLEINVDTGDVNIVVESPLDKELEYPLYGNKARAFVKKMFDSGEMPDTEKLIWY